MKQAKFEYIKVVQIKRRINICITVSTEPKKIT